MDGEVKGGEIILVELEDERDREELLEKKDKKEER